MEVYFLDVGQGTCQVILLGERTAIVVDCGSKSDRTALHFLKRFGVEYIARLIVSHSHDDHIGGAPGILGEYRDRIERICFVQDDIFLKGNFWARISELLQQDVLTKSQLVRLERCDCPQLIWSEATTDSRLRTYSPTAAENLLAQDAAEQNPTSAVLFLDCGRNRIIFASDSDAEQWDEMRAKAGRRFDCNILAVAHHAGRTHQSAEALSRLFGENVRPDVAVISVGTSNTHGHPRNDVIHALKDVGATVVCTQITRKCSRDLEALRPGVLRPINIVGRSSPTPDFTSSGNSRNVACAGTVLARVTHEALSVERLAAHQAAVDGLGAADQGCPICR